MIEIMANLISEARRGGERRQPDPERMRELVPRMARIMQEAGFQRREDNAAVFDRLADYFATWRGAVDGEWDYPERGLFLYGPTGTGKTTAMRIFSALFQIEIIYIRQLAKAFASNSAGSFWGWIDDLDIQHVIFDDIGNEGIVRHFGQPIPMQAIIDQRDDVFRRRGKLTFFTSNMEKSEYLAEMYGEAFRSRLLGLIGKGNFLKMDGKDNRF